MAAEAYVGATFRDPVLSVDLEEAERSLGESLPQELKNLLSETDGITGRTSSDAVWSLERIVRDNLRFRRERSFVELYMPFDPFLFFGDNGGGDQFASCCARRDRTSSFGSTRATVASGSPTICRTTFPAD
ncbi:SMI1/KNR4 family protein [Streptomyces sp. NPDC014006]|uniref:SMI1/KNR4 family protein n=1 Tax=Streptomyces sp. NPDC014006 TaxID=3364870 RepID=UPI0036FB0ECB